VVLHGVLTMTVMKNIIILYDGPRKRRTKISRLKEFLTEIIYMHSQGIGMRGCKAMNAAE